MEEKVDLEYLPHQATIGNRSYPIIDKEEIDKHNKKDEYKKIIINLRCCVNGTDLEHSP